MIRLRPSGVDEILIKRVQDWYEPGPGVFITSTSTLFSPAMLFTGTTTGAWYDPSDFTTLYRDAAGTLPVTAVEQPVGLMLDKSKGLVLGPELVTNGDFSQGTTGWSLPSQWQVINQQLSFVGGARQNATQVCGIVNGRTYEITFTIIACANFGAAYIAVGGVAYLAFSSLGITSTGTKKIIVSASGTDGHILFRGLDAITYTIDNISVRELPGNHAFNSSGNSANFPVLKEDATGRKYLSFNGTNQWLQTNSIDFTYGDKMFVSAGVRKLSDAAVGVFVEFSTSTLSNTRSFYCAAPETLGESGDFTALSRGSASINAGQIAKSTVLLAPKTVVFTATLSIADDLNALRINGAANGTNGIADQGTGNYGNYPLYIGARAGTSLWFNGRLYSLVVAGKQASAAEITSTETYINQKTGAY